MKTWGPEAWVVFFGGLATLLTAVAALIKSFITAKQSSLNTQAIHETNRTVATVASLVAPADPPARQTAPPTPSTESVAAEMDKAFNAATEAPLP